MIETMVYYSEGVPDTVTQCDLCKETLRKREYFKRHIAVCPKCSMKILLEIHEQLIKELDANNTAI